MIQTPSGRLTHFEWRPEDGRPLPNPPYSSSPASAPKAPDVLPSSDPVIVLLKLLTDQLAEFGERLVAYRLSDTEYPEAAA